MTTTKQAVTPAPAKSKPVQPSPAKPKQGSKDKPAPKTASSGKSNRSTQSKQDRVVAMLRSPQGTTVAAVMKATGWQKHSVHGFFAGVVRKKLGLNLMSEKTDDKRIYCIAEGKRAKASPSSRKRAA